jgi:proline racemase
MIHTVRTIDAHIGGQPVRLVVDGVPRLSGRTMARKRESMARQADHLRRMLVYEPRGHVDMCAALLTEPVTPGAHAGLLFMQSDGYTSLSGHSVIGVTTIALERGLITAAGDALTFDTEAGSVYARAQVQVQGVRQRVESVAVTNVPSFVHSAGRLVRIGTRDVRVDVAFGGVFYAIVDTEAVGIPLEASRLPELRRLGVQIMDALQAGGRVEHAADPSLSGVAGVVFTGAPRDPEAHLLNVTVFARGSIDRSPCAAGTAAVMAVLDAMGLLPGEQPFVHESLTGSLHRGRIVRRTQVGDLPAIVPEIEGTAWITGEHTFCADDDDPLREGFRLD